MSEDIERTERDFTRLAGERDGAYHFLMGVVVAALTGVEDWEPYMEGIETVVRDRFAGESVEYREGVDRAIQRATGELRRARNHLKRS